MSDKRGIMKKKKRAVTPDTKVWSASAWWRDSEPSEAVVALTERACLARIREAIRGMARRARDEDDDDETTRRRSLASYEDDIMWPGRCYEEPLRDVVRAGELAAAAKALEEDGYYYPELP